MAIIAYSSWVGVRETIEDEWIDLSGRVRDICIDTQFEEIGFDAIGRSTQRMSSKPRTRVELTLLALNIGTSVDELFRSGRTFWVKIKENAGPVSMTNPGYEGQVRPTQFKRSMNVGQVMTEELSLEVIGPLQESRTESQLRDAITRAVNSRKRKHK